MFVSYKPHLSWQDVEGDERVGELGYRGLEDKDAHGALDPIDGRRHIGVVFLDKHGVSSDCILRINLAVNL